LKIIFLLTKIANFLNFFFNFEGKVPLREVTEGNDDQGGENFGDGWIKMELFYKQLDEYIIQQYTNCHQQEIPE